MLANIHVELVVLRLDLGDVESRSKRDDHEEDRLTGIESRTKLIGRE